MALLTPPPTVKKTAGLFKPYTPRVYYEDIYGTRNPDEELDTPDVCESESDSEDEAPMEEALPREPHTSIDQGSGLSTSNARKAQYKIAPHVNAKTSVRVTPGKQVTPKKFGMFAAYDPLDGTVVSDIESGDGEHGFESRDPGGRHTETRLQQRGTAGRATRSRSQQERKRSSVTMQRPKTRRLISREIAEHARERKAALRNSRPAPANSKAATPKGPLRRPIVSEDCSADELNANATSSKARARSRQGNLKHAREGRSSGRGGSGGQGASSAREKSFREVGGQDFRAVVKRKLMVMVSNSGIVFDGYVEC